MIDIVLDDGAIMPTRAHEADAGIDLYAPYGITIYGKDSAKIDTGVHIAIPYGYAGFLKSKSGLNVNHCITGEGVIDCGYTGSIVAKLYNNSPRAYKINKGDKIIQLVIAPVILEELRTVDKLEDTERGINGFGSTGR